MALDESRKSRFRNLFHRSKGNNRNTSGNSSTGSTKASGNHGRSTSGGSPRNRQDTVAAKAARSTPHLEHFPPENYQPSAISTASAAPRDPIFSLPQVSQGRDFSSSFQDLTLSSSPHSANGNSSPDGNLPTRLDEGRNSEHIADRNIAITAQNRSSVLPLPKDPSISAAKSQPLIPHVDQHSGNVADWNIVRNDDPVMEAQDQAPMPLKVKKRDSNLHKATVDAPANGVPDPRGASWTFTPLAMEGGRDDYAFGNAPIDARVNDRKASLDKPLPPAPSVTTPNTGVGQTLDVAREDPTSDMPGPFDLNGVDVQKEPETVSLHEQHAPAVTHEAIREDRHEIREEMITRETHEHHVYHRILPIKDIEVKPARHFVPIQDGYVEVAEEDLPGRTRDKTNWAIAEMVSKSTPQTQQAATRGQFSARKFAGTEGDDKEYISPEGHPVKEQWWVHPPTLQTEAEGTYPFHFGSEDPRDDGLRAKLPSGNVIGVSERLMEKRKKEGLEPSV